MQNYLLNFAWINANKQDMSNPFAIFKVKPEERWLFAVAITLFVALNALIIGSHWDMYTKPLMHGGSWSVFKLRFEMSGYDCWSWMTLSEGRVFFETIRHPLYLSFLYPMYWLNHWLMSWTGVNWSVFMIATVLVLSATYAAVFTYRILRELVGLRRGDATLLVALLFSFGHVMVPAMVPDHFIISMMLLTMTAYICGKKMQTGRAFTTLQTALLLFFTSGIAASNGVKTILAGLFANGRRVLRPRYALLGVALPLVALLAIQRCQYHAVEVPQKEAIHKIEKANAKKLTAKKKQQIDNHHKWMAEHAMKPAGEGLLALMDFKTPRLRVFAENFCGEAILLHKAHALEDALQTRPLVVGYEAWWQYAFSAVVMLLFAAGLWLGRKERLMQLLACWFCFDFFLNMVLGFGVNEVYIMTSGWAFSIPVALSFVFRRLKPKALTALRLVMLFVVLYVMTANVMTIYNHLY